MNTHTHLVFVYGTLRYGFGLNRVLSDSEFVGEYVASGFAMFDLGPFPYVIRTGDEYDTITGEVYRVDRHTLALLDGVEGVPRHYQRERLDVERFPLDEPVEVYVYASHQPRTPRVIEGDYALYRIGADSGGPFEYEDEPWDGLDRLREKRAKFYGVDQ